MVYNKHGFKKQKKIQCEGPITYINKINWEKLNNTLNFSVSSVDIVEKAEDIAKQPRQEGKTNEYNDISHLVPVLIPKELIEKRINNLSKNKREFNKMDENSKKSWIEQLSMKEVEFLFNDYDINFLVGIEKSR